MAGVYIILGALLLAAIFFAVAMMARLDAVAERVEAAAQTMREEARQARREAARETIGPPDARGEYSAPMVERARMKLMTKRGDEG